MPILRLRDVLHTVEGNAHGPSEELEFRGVSTDTREPLDGRLFVALRGPHFDAHDYLGEAARKGARAALVDRVVPPDEVAPLLQIRVRDTLEALQSLARHHAARCAAARIGITGSNGKTTTKELVRSALGGGPKVQVSPRSFNNHVGVPLTLLGIEEHTRHAVVELGSNGPGEIEGLARLVAPSVGVITNCTWAHVERLGDLDGVIREKGALVEALPPDGVAVLNADDPAFDVLRERTAARVVSFGIRRPAELRATDVRFDLDRLTFQLDGERVFVPLGGCHNVSNTLAALAVAEACGRSRDVAVRSLRETRGPPMRLRPVVAGELLLLDDTYNANPGSVEAAFRTLGAVHPERRKVLVLGDMKELGDQAERLHRDVGRQASLLGEGVLVAVGRWAEALAHGAREAGMPADRVILCRDAEQAATVVPELVQPGDVVLVKGSRAMAMEIVLQSLETAGGVSAG